METNREREVSLGEEMKLVFFIWSSRIENNNITFTVLDNDCYKK